MNRIALASLVVAASAALEVHAADMPVAMPTKAPPAVSSYDWTGIYFGVNAGYGVARNASSTDAIFFGSELFPIQPRGALGGGQLGINWQQANWVFGLEADIQATGQDNSVCVARCIPQWGLLINQKLPWFGTVRGRIGYAAGPVLYYATGGLAYGRINTNVTADGGPVEVHSFGTTRGGWTMGGGVEAALSGHWSVKAEYLYVDLGGVSPRFDYFGFWPTVISSYVRDHIFRAGLNYRLNDGGATGSAMPVKSANTVASWSGFYLGANAGYSVARNPATFVADGFQPQNYRFTLDQAGPLGGVQAGYNWQISHWLFGLESDIQGTSATQSTTCVLFCTTGTASPDALSVSARLPWFGTARARVGWASQSALLYATGGLAYGRATLHADYLNNGLVFGTVISRTVDVAAIKTGWTAGGGIETALAGGWSVKFEYLYVNLGSLTGAFTADFGLGFTNTNIVSASFREHVARAGLNYRFGGPIAASY